MKIYSCSANAVLCWIASFLLCNGPFVSHCSSEPSSSCRDGVECPTGAAGEGALPPLAKDYLYRLGTRYTGYKAVDICFVVAATTTMQGAQRWTQIFVPLLEALLKENGVGSINATNRYCLVQFGSHRRFLTARFLRVNGEIFFPAPQFVMARRQLKRNGDIADGYQAIDYATKYAPFRKDDPHIANHLILVNNMGRSVLAMAANLTRESILKQLVTNNITLDAIVEADFRIHTNGTSETALGVNGYRNATLVEPDGGFTTAEGEVLQNSTQGQTIHDYVTLALDSGGSSWSIQLLAPENLKVLQSAIKAFVVIHGMFRLSEVEVCEKCRCMPEPESIELPEDCSTGSLVCEVPTDQERCLCMFDDAPPECADLIQPTPVYPVVTSVLAPTGPTETPLPLALEGSLTQFPGGEVELVFSSERSNAQYYCFLIANNSLSPSVSPCTSPHYVKHLESGHYQLLLFGKRKSYIGSQLFNFRVPLGSQDPPPEVSLRALPDANRTVAVVITTEGFESSDVNLLCSLAGGDFFECSSPHFIHQDDIGSNGVQVVVVATDSRGRAAARMLRVERPAVPTPPPDCSPLMIMNITAEPPDLFGRILIRFNTSCSEVHCICRTNTTNAFCRNEFQADPRELGVGTHTITISCMDYDGFVDTKNIKVPLQLPPRPPLGPLSCDLRVMGPTEHSTLIAVFTCDRRVIANCQVSSLATQPCNSPNGVYEVDVSGLDPGPHLFILNVDDGYGKTLMKIVPFTIGTAHRKCCPNISRNSTATQVHSSLQVDLELNVTAGNCSDTEGFRYNINWGDGASETGTSGNLSPIRSSRFYELQGDYIIELSYCNNPAMEENVCCDSLNLPVHLQHQ